MANRYTCAEHTQERDGLGESGWRTRVWRESAPRNRRAGLADSVVGRYSQLTFDRGTQRQIRQVDCVLPANADAIPFMKSRLGAAQERVAIGEMISFEWSGTIECYWNQGANILDCGGVECSAGSQMRVTRKSSGDVALDGGGPMGTYSCTNDCTISAYGWEGAGYNCENDDWGAGAGGNEGGGGQNGGGGSSGGSTGEGPLPDPNLFFGTDTIPDCAAGNLHPYRTTWCNGTHPTPSDSATIQAAITRMHAIGGVCTTRATTLQGLLNRGRIRLYHPTALAIGGAAPVGQGDNAWMILSEAWITQWPDATRPATNGPHPRTLQSSLAHEADHLAGDGGHTDPEGYETTNSRACSDVP
ncbi:MAG: hypothetical protein IT353_23750 [Gemmatimonadaceae bacterium]|nr:hypothetical protein [Gemmatimonadaceae bacterium]